MSNRGSQALLFSIVCMSLGLVPGAAVAQDEAVKTTPEEGRNVGAGEQGFVAFIVDGPPIKADQVKSADHRQYARGMTCAECHTSTFDFVSTASVQWANNFPQLTQEEIWAKVVAFLPGRERFALASVRNDEPTATTVDMVLDKEDRVFYVVSEVGTEKLLEIREKPAISAVRFEGWTVAEGGAKEWRSVQIKGTAELIPSSDPRFYPALVKYNLVRISRERAERRFDLMRITPVQIWYFDTTLSGERKSPYQLWKRK